MFLLIDKPKSMTSFAVVRKIREITGERKVGHGGTLDPNATGLLIIAVSREGTKQLGEILRKPTKRYIATLQLGEERDTYDTEGRVVRKYKGNNPPTLVQLNEVIKKYKGEIMQQPPIYSAIKIKGKKAYELARKGKEVELKKRKVTIHSIKVVEYNYPKLILEVKVSSGTYIRSLANDIGTDLEVGAYLADLRRTKIGKISVDDAINLDMLNSDNWKSYIINKLKV